MATVPTAPNPFRAPDQEIVQSSLEKLAGRIRLALWLRHVSYAVVAASAASILLAVVWHFAHWSWPVLLGVVGLYLLALAAGTVTAFRIPIPPLVVARLADERQGLKQRLSSSLALAGDSAPLDSLFIRLQM